MICKQLGDLAEREHGTGIGFVSKCNGAAIEYSKIMPGDTITVRIKKDSHVQDLVTDRNIVVTEICGNTIKGILDLDDVTSPQEVTVDKSCVWLCSKG